MDFRRLSVFALAVLALGALLPAVASAAPAPLRAAQVSQATLTILEGGVTVVSSSLGSPSVGVSGQGVAEGDRVITANPGRAILTFSDGSEMTLEAGTEVTVRSLQQAASGGLFVDLVQAAGTTVHRVAQLANVTDYQLETPLAAALVRGTEYTATITRDPRTTQVSEQTFAVSEGVVEIRAGSGTCLLQAGETLRLQPGVPLPSSCGQPVAAAAQGGPAITAAAPPEYGQGAGVTRARTLPRTGTGPAPTTPDYGTAGVLVSLGLCAIVALLYSARRRAARGLPPL
jgi:hypothetical protein